MKKLHLKASNKYKKVYDLQKFKDFYEQFDCEKIHKDIETISVEKFKKLCKKNPDEVLIIDVRADKEFANFSIKGSVSIPLNIIVKKSSLQLIHNLSTGKIIFTLCKKGISSKKASELLLKERIKSFSIEGGIQNISQDPYFNNK